MSQRVRNTVNSLPVAAAAGPAHHPAVAQVRRATGAIIPLASYHLTRLGPTGLSGLAAALTAIVLGFFAFVSVPGVSNSLTQQIQQARMHPVVQANTDDELGKIITTLPTRAQMPTVIGKVLQQATLAGVTLETGHYTYTPPRSGGIARYELEFPVKADYPSVRDFINRTLSAVPAVGLDRLHIERKAVGDAVVKADVRFVVFLRGEAEK